MGWKDAINDALDDNKQIAKQSLNDFFTLASDNKYGPPVSSSGVYTVSPKDWYKTFPYRFVVEKKSEDDPNKIEKYYYSLPIPPESLSYQMISASQLTPTLGGVVEETSENVFWQISLSGTTGISIGRQYGRPGINEKSGLPKNTKDKLDMPALKEENFRTVLKGGIIANTANTVSNLASDAVDILDDPIAGAFAAFEALATTAQRFRRSGVITTVADDNPFLNAAAKAANIDPKLIGEVDATNGYVEIHLLHNFLIVYSKLKEKSPEEYNLFFESHKDNMKWQIAVRSFVFQKNANQPHLYKYNIGLQGFNLTPSADSDTRKKLAVDRFGPGGDLGGISSVTIMGALTKALAIGRKFQKMAKSGNWDSLISKPPVV